jgi:hypothetical protein
MEVHWFRKQSRRTEDTPAEEEVTEDTATSEEHESENAISEISGQESDAGSA